MRIVAPAYHSAEPSAELRRRVLRGASFLLGRQAVTGVLALGAEPMIARTVGPSQYGLWIASLALFTYARGLCSLGIEIYLIRSEASISAQQLDQAFTILAGLGASAALVAAGVLPLAEHWAGIPGLAHVAGALFLLLPLCLTTLVPTATLERTLDYRHIALVESAARILFYAVTLGLLLDGYRVWALVAGYWAQQSIIALFYYAFTGYRPRLSMRAHSAYEMVSYGLGYSSSIWIFQLRNLVNPLIVGRYAGAAAVGYVGLAERLVTMLSFARGAAWRISIPVMSRIQASRSRMARAVSEGMVWQALALAPLLLAGSVALPTIIRRLFGIGWSPVTQIYPFIAVSFLVNAIFSLHSSALYALKENGRVAIFHLCHTCLLAGGALFIVPRIGWAGYGWAELLALASYGVVHRLAVASTGDLDYGFAAPLVAAVSLALFWRELGAASAVGLIALAFWPPTWRSLRLVSSQLRSVVHTAS